jgi:ABC-type antimicrobial peptide transport system permease subunit
VITETTARQAFGDENPIGRLLSGGLRFNPQNAVRVVGVVRDPRLKAPRGPFGAVVFLAFDQSSSPVDSVIVRVSGNLGSFIPLADEEIRKLSPALSLQKTQPLLDLVAEQLRRERMMAILSGAFAVVAMVLAAIGLYGVIAYTVARRTNEIGLRLALGAARTRVVWMVLRENMVVVIAGLVFGVGATIAASRLIASQLFDLAPSDPATLGIAVAIMLAVAAVASFLPAWRASRIDPTTALRYE